MDACLLIIVVVLGSSDIPLSSSVVNAEQLKEAELILRGMQDSHERLVRGVCYVKGNNTTTRVVSDAGDKEVSEELVDCFCVFDFKNGLYRFDRNIPSVDGMHKGGKFIRTPSHIYQAFGVDPINVRAIMRSSPDSDPYPVISPFDIRSIGLFNLAGPYWKTTFDGFWESILEGQLVEFSKVNNDVYQLAWKLGKKQRETLTVWIDGAKGYSLVRMESHYTSPTSSVKTLTETSWDEIGGTWVPTSLRLTDDQAQNHTEAEWTIDWQSVNEPVDEKYFKPEDFVSGKDVGLYDNSLGQTVYIGPIGIEQSAVELEEISSNWNWPRGVLVVAGTALLVIFITLLVIRRLRHA